jgi:sterol 3beta-glucosyltransferase
MSKVSFKFVLLAPGSRGDVLPLVAVGSRLKLLGHNVTVVCHTNYEKVVRDAGLQFHPVAGDPNKNRGGQATTGNDADLLWQQQLNDYKVAANGANFICFNWFGIAGLHLAEALKVPCAALWLVPFTRTNKFPSILLSDPKTDSTKEALRHKHDSKWELVSHVLFEQMMWLPFAGVLNGEQLFTVDTLPQNTAGLPGKAVCFGFVKFSGISRLFIFQDN